MDTETGVISSGGIGFDINCGMRLVTTNLSAEEIQPYLRRLVDRLFERVPTETPEGWSAAVVLDI